MIRKIIVPLPGDVGGFNSVVNKLTTEVFLPTTTMAPSTTRHEKLKPPLVFCHGLAANRLYWHEVAMQMANEGYVCVSYDLRDHGENSDRPSAQSVNTRSIATLGLDKNCADLQFLLEYLNASWADVVGSRDATDGSGQKKTAASGSPELCPNPWNRGAVLVGHSYGGNIVLEMATRSPALVHGLVCVDGGFIELQKKFPDFAHCVLALSPPSFLGVTGEELEQMVRERWCQGWPEQGIQAMLANFHIQKLEAQNLTETEPGNPVHEESRVKSSEAASDSIEVSPTGTRPPPQRQQLWVEPKLAAPVHRQLLHDLWQHRPSDRYALVRPDLPVLLVPTGAKAVSPFSACKLADVQEAIHLLQARSRVAPASPSASRSSASVGAGRDGNGSVEPINDVEYLHSSPHLRVRWVCKPGHDAPAQYASLIAQILIDNCQDGFLTTL